MTLPPKLQKKYSELAEKKSLEYPPSTLGYDVREAAKEAYKEGFEAMYEETKGLRKSLRNLEQLSSAYFIRLNSRRIPSDCIPQNGKANWIIQARKELKQFEG